VPWKENSSSTELPCGSKERRRILDAELIDAPGHTAIEEKLVDGIR
jgi:hypothetical protein